MVWLLSLYYNKNMIDFPNGCSSLTQLSIYFQRTTEDIQEPTEGETEGAQPAKQAKCDRE